MKHSAIHRLHSELFTHIGSFMTYNDRLNAFTTSQVFATISHDYTSQTIKLEKNPNFVTHLLFIKRFKPKCDHLEVKCNIVQDTIPDTVLSSMREMTSYINTHFKRLCLQIVNTSNQNLEAILKAARDWNVTNMAIVFKPNESITLQLIETIKQFTQGRTFDVFNVELHNDQLELLHEHEIINKITSTLIVKVQHNFIPITLNMEHVKHIGMVELVTNAETLTIHSPENITVLTLYDMIWFNGDSNHLIQNFRGAKNEGKSMKLTNVYMMEHTNSIKTCHVANNYWYQLLHVLPSTCHNIVYYANSRNIGMIQMVKIMCSKIGIDRMIVGYDSDDAYLIAKVVKHFIPQIKIRAKKHFTCSQELQRDMTLNEIYTFMAEETQQLWSWLENIGC
jgi:hypothetical protein